jgi:PKD repeat protein
MKWTAIALLLATPAAGLQGRGLVTGVQVSAPSVESGATLTVTVVGSNPCGAANIDYGDGTAITYAITSLPVTQSHQYSKAGNFTVTARGMGNCDGEAGAQVKVTAPPPPAATAEITAVTFVPQPGIVRQPVTIDVAGRGACGFVVDYGDGNRQDFSGTLPRRVTHTYAIVDTYTVIVAPVAPCVGKFTQKLEVVPRGGPRLTGLQIRPSPANAREPVSFLVEGVGTCSYTIDFDDGNNEERAKPLPDRATHVYPAPGDYRVEVRASGGCTGYARRTLTIR